MRFLYATVESLLLTLLSACGQEGAFSLPFTEAVTVYNMSTGTTQSIQPNTELHQRLGLRVSHNQNGWKPYAATPPARGIAVHAQELDVQFIGEQVLLHSRHGVFTKKVALNEYAFLSN